jgi:Ca-activated chloride channel family protein
MQSVTRARWTVAVAAPLALAVGLGLAANAAGRPQAGRATPPTSGERALFVSVLDKDGAAVGTLTPADFVVREDGMAREILRAEKATEPVTIALLVDTSQASQPYIPDMRRALAAFVKAMGGKNPMAIVGFGERPTVLTDYTLDVPSLLKGVDRVFATNGSGSYLLEAVHETCKALKKRDFERGLILAVTGGGPEYSERNYQEFFPILRDAGVTLDVMSFDITPPNMSNSGQRNREQFIDAATRVTGGARFSLLTSMALEDALKKLADQLANQYRVTDFRPERLIQPQKVEVTVRQAGLTVRGTPAKGKQG